jgi:hypothetical protein
MTTMKLFARRPTYGAEHLVNGYDWPALQGTTVVDVSRLKGGHIWFLFCTYNPYYSLSTFRTLLSFVALTQHFSVEAQLAT